MRQMHLRTAGIKLAATALVPWLSGCATTPSIISAAADGSMAEVRSLLAAGADVNARQGVSHQTPVYPNALAAAAAKGRTDLVGLLLERGASADQAGSDGATPLMFAAYCDQAGTAKALIEAGADVNLQARVNFIWPPGCNSKMAWHGPKWKGNALGIAVRNGYVKMMKLLLSNGADTAGPYNWEDSKGYWREGTLTDMAVRNGQEEAARVLETDAGKFKALARVNAARAAAKAALEEKLPDIEALERAGDEAARAGEKPEALENYIAALRETPAGTAKDYQLRGKAIRLALTLQEPPSVPEEGRLHAERAKAFLKRASGPEDYSRVAGEFREASLAAPWWADIYYNLGLVLEKSGDLEAAEEYLGLYLLAAPRAPDAEAVRRKIVELQVARELEL